MPLKRQESRNRRNFMEEPEEGWLHDDDALAVGGGVFYTFPLTLLGSVKIEASLSSLSEVNRTLSVREMMHRLMERAGKIKPKKRKVGSEILPFIGGEVTVADIPVSLGISADGMIVMPNIPGQDQETATQQTLFFHTMPMISIAVGGSGPTYDMVSYVAKDRTGRREAYIFDCGAESDEVLATLGQAFVLAQEIAAKRRNKPSVSNLKKEYLQVDEALYEHAEDITTPAIIPEQADYEVADNPGHRDSVQFETNEYDTAEVLKDQPTYEYAEKQEDALYDNSAAAPSEEPIYDVATTNKIVSELNNRDFMRRSKKIIKGKSKKSKKSKKAEPESEEVGLQGIDQQDLSRPSWVCISEAGSEANKVDLGSLLQQFKSQAIEEDDE